MCSSTAVSNVGTKQEDMRYITACVHLRPVALGLVAPLELEVELQVCRLFRQ